MTGWCSAVNRPRVLILIIMLLAAGLRLVDLTGVPPGLEHDEVANWLIDRDILAGEHGIYFTQAYGHEAGYHYLQAAAVALFGNHALSLRLPSAFAGLVGIAVSYALAKQLFGERVALINAATLAVLFWPLFYGRLGVRAILLPAVSGLAAWLFWRGLRYRWQEKDGWGNTHPLLSCHPSPLLAGLSLYTYMAARAVPLIFGVFVLYLLLFHRPLVKRNWRGLALFFILMIVVAAPLGIWLWTHPGAEHRISEINQPLNALLAGDLRPVANNSLKLLGFFGWRGDPLVRQNIPGRPVFDPFPLGAILFYGGVLLALWRWRRPEYAFILIWLAVSLTPSLVTADAPSSIRCINGLVVVGMFVGLGVGKLGVGKLGNWVLVIWLAAVAGWTVRDYFFRWPAEAEVQFVWQTGLQEAAAALDTDPAAGSVVVAGWTPGSMDPPSMSLFMQRDNLVLRYINPTQALLWPPEGGRMVRPAVLPLDPALAAELDRWGAWIEERDQFIIHHLPAVELNFISPPVVFSNQVTFLGHRVTSSSLLTYWRAAGPVEQPLHIFVHLLGPAGAIVGQHDGLGAPAEYWRPGDVIVQTHHLGAPTIEYNLRVGLYNPETGERLRYDDGSADTIVLPKVIIP